MVWTVCALSLAQVGPLKGRLVNGSTGQAGQAGLVQLIDLQSGFTPVASLTNVNGSFEVEVPEGNQSQSFLVQARVGATVYSERWDGNPSNTIVITLYDASDEVEVHSSLGSVAIFAYEHSIELGFFYNLDNQSDPPLVFERDEGVFSYDVVPGYEEINVSTRFENNMPLRQAAPEPGTRGVLSYSLKPGRTQLIVTTTHRYENQSFSFDVPITEEQGLLRMLVLPANLDVTGPGVELVDRDMAENVALYQWQATSPGQKPHFTVTGTPAPSRDVTVNNAQETTQKSTPGAPERVPNPLHRWRWWVVASVVVGCSLAAFIGSRSA